MKEINYVDLGLKSGIKWSDCYNSGNYNFQTLLSLSEEQYKFCSKHLPTLKDFEELISSCKIHVCKKGFYDFYLITGPNGNKIRIICGGGIYRGFDIGRYSFVLKDGFFINRDEKVIFIYSNFSGSIKLRTISELYWEGKLVFIQR